LKLFRSIELRFNFLSWSQSGVSMSELQAKNLLALISIV
jgi:hypothetical protein